MIKRKNFTITLSIIVAIAIMLAQISLTSAFAAEDTGIFTVATSSEKVSPRASFQNGFVWNANTTSVTVQITQQFRANTDIKTYTGVLSRGNSGIAVFTFKNGSTSFSQSFTCNGGQYIDTLGVTIPVGTYTVTLSHISSGCAISQLSCTFNRR